MPASLSKVLLMIDQSIVFLDIKSTLERNNFSVIEKNHKNISLLSEPPPDFIILSYYLLRKEPELLDKIKKLESKICILSDQPLIDPIYELNFIVVTLPFEATDLLRVLKLLQQQSNSD